MMAKGSPPPPRASPAPPREQAAHVPGDAFTQWLEGSLHRLYDEVVQEPVPPELLRLLEKEGGRR